MIGLLAYLIIILAKPRGLAKSKGRGSSPASAPISTQIPEHRAANRPHR